MGKGSRKSGCIFQRRVQKEASKPLKYDHIKLLTTGVQLQVLKLRPFKLSVTVIYDAQ